MNKSNFLNVTHRAMSDYKDVEYKPALLFNITVIYQFASGAG